MLEPEAFEKAAHDQLVKIADAIAADARRHASFSELRGTKWGYRTVEDDDGIRVLTYFPFAHLDEWGTAHQQPTGALRSAAAARGQFKPSPK